MFNIGDLVYLKSGSPSMTVSAVDGDNITCDWMQGSQHNSRIFQAAMLVSEDPEPQLEHDRQAKRDELAAIL